MTQTNSEALKLTPVVTRAQNGLVVVAYYDRVEAYNSIHQLPSPDNKLPSIGTISEPLLQRGWGQLCY